MSLFSSFLSASIKNFNTLHSIIAYVVVYFISLILSLVLKRISSKNLKTQFWFILSILEFFLFFIIEFSILYDEIGCTVMQKISQVNRIIYLLLRYFVVNELLISEPSKIIFISIAYIGNMLFYFLLIKENMSIENIICIFLEMISIILTLSIIKKSDKERKLLGVLKQCFQCFFLIKKGKENNLLHIQGSTILNSSFENELQKTPKFTNLAKSYLNNFFLIDRNYFNGKNFHFLDPSILNKKQDEEFIEYDLEYLIKKTFKFENGKDIKINVKIKENLSKNYIFLIKYLFDKGKTYILFNIVESEPNEKTHKQEGPNNEMKIRESFISHLNTFQKSLAKIQKSVQKLSGIDALDEEKIDQIKALIAHLKINDMKIQNLIIAFSENNDEISSNLTKANIIGFVKDILNILIPLAKARKIEIKFSVNEIWNNLIVKLNLESLRLVLLNLLLTSIKDALPNSIINFSVIFLGENIKEIQFIIQDSLHIMSQERLNEIQSLMSGQKIQPFQKNIKLVVLQKLIFFLGGQKAFKITSKIGEGSIYNLIVEPKKIYKQKERPKRFSLISNAKSDSKRKAQLTQNTLTFHTNELKSFNSSLKAEESLNLNQSRKNNDYKINANELSSCHSSFKIEESLNSNQSKKFYDHDSVKKDSATKLTLDSSNHIPLIHESNNEQANCNCRGILVIYSKFFKLSLLKAILNTLKYEFWDVEKEETAINKLISQSSCSDVYCGGFKLILVDCFPSEECPSLIRKIKNLMDEGLINTIPILGAVSLISKDQIQQCLDSGMAGLIPNPLNKNTVLNSIIKWTDLLQNKIIF